jgi:pimeloyl-ACP methyl ester carboxylesterase
MTIDRPIHFFREQGEGTAVICLHSNASTSSQWRALGEALCERFRVIAVDGYGAGKSPPWPAEVAMRLDDEVRLLEAVLGRAGERFHLVGHSYGAAVAIKMALTYPKRVRSVAIYEPTLFHLVADGDPPASPAAGIWQAATDAAEAVDAGNNDAGARRFIDFWMGNGAWDAMPASRQAAVADSVRNVRGWRDALFNEALSPSNLALLTTPVLCLWGEDSPESSLSVVRSLCALLPKVTCAPLPGLGYMGPITHPELVNARIGEFLSRH